MPIFSWSDLVFGSTAIAMTGSGNVMRSSVITLFGRAQRVAGRDVLQTHGRGDVARANFLDFAALGRVHLQDAADALLSRLDRVVDGVARVQRARIDTEERQRADERIGHDLERERRERLVVARLRVIFLVVLVDALDRRTIRRRRQQLHDGIEHRLHALVLERGAAEDRNDRRRERARADARDDFGFGEVAAIEVLVHQLFGRLGRGLDHEVARLLRTLDEVRRNVAVLELHALGFDVPVDRLHLDQIDDAFEVFLGADRNLHRNRVRAEARLQLADDLVEVGAGAVHLVDERKTRHAVLVGLTPDGFGLRLHAADRAQHEHGAVEHAQANARLRS